MGRGGWVGRRGWVWVGLGWAAVVSLVLLLSNNPASLSNDAQAERDVRLRLAQLSGHVQHLRHLDQEKNKAFRELREQLLVLMNSADPPGSGKVPPTLRGLAGNGSVAISANASRNIERLPEAIRTQILQNLTTSDLEMGVPSLYNFLPHLVNTPDGLTPAVRISAANRRHLHTVVGIPTVKRPKISYLLTTLRSLFDNLDEQEQSEVLVVVMLGSESGVDDWVSEQIVSLHSEFPEQIRAGLLEILVPPPAFFPPDLANIPSTFDDSTDRMKWRTKQNLDYAYLMMYAQNRAQFYLQLEDDVITKPGFLGTMKTFIDAQADIPWLLLEFSSLGFIGKLFRSSDLPALIQFILMFHREKPVDWLLDHLFYVKFCSPEKAPKVCQATKNKYRIRFKPALFQHVGIQSSLKGKVQKLKEKDFGKSQLHRGHSSNPPANVSTSLKTYQKYSLDRAYRGETFFWGLLPQAGDWLRFDLRPPAALASFLFRSGSAEHPDDRFYNSSVGVLHADGDDDFLPVAVFGPSGSASATLPEPARLVKSIRIVVEAESDNWLILSEIWLRPWDPKSSAPPPS